MRSTTPPDPHPFGIRSLILIGCLPTFLFAVGQGAVLRVIPLFVRELGASVAVAGLGVAMRSLGTLVLPRSFDCPQGVDSRGSRSNVGVRGAGGWACN